MLFLTCVTCFCCHRLFYLILRSLLGSFQKTRHSWQVSEASWLKPHSICHCGSTMVFQILSQPLLFLKGHRQQFWDQRPWESEDVICLDFVALTCPEWKSSPSNQMQVSPGSSLKGFFQTILSTAMTHSSNWDTVYVFLLFQKKPQKGIWGSFLHLYHIHMICKSLWGM